MTASGQSLMPEGLEKDLKPRDLADLIAFLASAGASRANPSESIMPKPTDIRPVAVELYFLPIKTRVPLKFGPEITTEVTCARVKMTVEDRRGRRRRRLGRDAALGPVGLAQPV